MKTAQGGVDSAQTGGGGGGGGGGSRGQTIGKKRWDKRREKIGREVERMG